MKSRRTTWGYYVKEPTTLILGQTRLYKRLIYTSTFFEANHLNILTGMFYIHVLFCLGTVLTQFGLDQSIRLICS